MKKKKNLSLNLSAIIDRFWVGKDVVFLWAGQVISQAGDSVYQIAIVWIMLQMTGSGSVTGLGAMSAYIPVLVFGLFAGVVTDRFDRRKIMILADGIRAAVVLLIPLMWWMGILTPFLIIIITFVVGCFSTLFNPARDSLIPDIALPQKLGLSNSLIQTSWQLAMFVGPAMAGILIPVIGVIHLFEVDSLTFLISMGGILLITSSAGKLEKRKTDMDGRSWFSIHSLKEGMDIVLKTPAVMHLLIVTFFYNLLLMGIPLVAVPVFVRDVLDNKPETFAWLQAVYAGGMLIGAPFVVAMLHRINAGKLILIGIILDGITFCPLYWICTKKGALILMLLHSIVIPLIVVPRTTLIQHITQRNIWGRIFAFVSISVTGASSLSCILAGVACDYMNVKYVIIILGCLAALVGVFGFFSKELRNAVINE